MSKIIWLQNLIFCFNLKDFGAHWKYLGLNDSFSDRLYLVSIWLKLKGPIEVWPTLTSLCRAHFRGCFGKNIDSHCSPKQTPVGEGNYWRQPTQHEVLFLPLSSSEIHFHKKTCKTMFQFYPYYTTANVVSCWKFKHFLFPFEREIVTGRVSPREKTRLIFWLFWIVSTWRHGGYFLDLHKWGSRGQFHLDKTLD